MIAANVSNTDDWFKQASPAITNFNATELLKDLQSATTVSDQLAMWQRDLNNFDNASLVGINYPALKKAFESWMTAAKIPDAIKSTLLADPKTKLPTYVTKYLSINSNDPASKAAYKEQLIKDFGGLKDSKGASVISPTLIDEIIDGNQDFSTLVNRVTSAAKLAANKELGADAKQIVDITKTDVYKDLIDNPDKLTTSYNKNVAGLTQDATTGSWGTGKSGVVTSDPTGTSGTYDYTGGIGQLSTNGTIDPAKMANMVNSYDTQKGVWSLPSINKETGLFEAGTSPYGNLLANSLNNFKSTNDPYSPNYVSSLATMQPAALTSSEIAALKQTMTDPGTSKDLLNVINSIGVPADKANAPGGITAGSKVSPTILNAYQSINTPSAGSQTTGQTKPGAPDITGTTVPKSTAPVTALPTTTPGLLTGQTIKTKEQADIEKAIADKKLQDDQKKLADENAEKIKLNSTWYKAGYESADDYSKGMALGYSSGADYYNYLKNLTLVPKTDTLPGGTKTDTLPGGTKTDTLPGGTKTDTLPGGTKTDTLPGITGLNTPLYHKDTDSWLTFSDQAKAKDILAQLDALGPVKPLAKTGELNLDPNTEAGRANIAAGNSPTTWNASWEKSPNNPDFIGSPFYDPNRATILSDKKILNDQLNAIRTQTDWTGTVYKWLPDYGVWQPQTQTAPVTNQGIATGTSSFTTPENMNTNAGGITTVLPAQQPAQVQQQPAATQYTDMNYITPAMRQQITADPSILQRRPDLQGAIDWSVTQDARRMPELTSGQLAQQPAQVQQQPAQVQQQPAQVQQQPAQVQQQPAATQYTDMNYITPAMRQQITADPSILQRRPDLQGAMDWSATQDARRMPELTSGQLAQ